MELDALKNSWNTISIDIDQNEFDIIAATKKEMTSPLAKLKEKSKKQTKILPILFAFLVVIAVKLPKANDHFFIWMALILLPLITLYYYFNLKLIAELEVYNGSVKEDIQIKIKKIINSNRTYLILTRVAVVLVIIAVEVLMRFSQLNLFSGFEIIKTIAFPLRLLIYAAAFGFHYVISTYTFEFYFGKHIKQLKRILSEMQ